MKPCMHAVLLALIQKTDSLISSSNTLWLSQHLSIRVRQIQKLPLPQLQGSHGSKVYNQIQNSLANFFNSSGSCTQLPMGSLSIEMVRFFCLSKVGAWKKSAISFFVNKLFSSRFLKPKELLCLYDLPILHDQLQFKA